MSGSSVRGLVLGVEFLIGSPPALFGPLEWIVTLIGLDCPWRSVSELHQALLFCFVIQRVHFYTVNLFHLAVSFREANQVLQMRLRMSVFPDRVCVLLCRRRCR